MRRLLLVLLTLLGLTASLGCSDPCEKLAEKICVRVKDERACERSRKDMEGFSEGVCKQALAIYDRLYER